MNAAERHDLIQEASQMIRDYERQMLVCPDCVVLPYGTERPGDFRLMAEHAGFVRACKRHK